jgi:hypothetical protein
MSHSHTIVATSLADFRTKVADLHNLLNGTAPLLGVSGEPLTTGKGGKKTKDTAAASEQSATPATSSGVKADVGSTATVVEPEPDADEDDGLGDEPTITRDDVKTLLIECKNKFKDKPSLVGELVGKVGGKYGAKKLADVKDEDLPALHALAVKKLG